MVFNEGCMFSGPQYGGITRFLGSTLTMGGMALCTWLNLQLLEGQKPSKRVEFWVGKRFDNNSRMFFQ